jgi:hypothetical protein
MPRKAAPRALIVPDAGPASLGGVDGARCTA